jgi:hypothetical protein
VADYDGTSWRYFRDVRPLLRNGPRPVAVLLRSANPDREFFSYWTKSHAEGPPGVWVVDGPPAPVPAGGVATGPATPIGAGNVGWAAVALLAMVWIVGSGWAVAVSERGSWFAASALAPAVGVAVVVAAGVLADRAGIRLGSGGGVGVLLVGTAAGWGLAAAAGRLRLRRSTPDAEAIEAAS